MGAYDPDKPAAAADWLEMDEAERIRSVAAFHRLEKVRLPNLQLHAVVHVIVENQLALDERTVVDTLARLQAEGLSRHDAVHAIGSVLAEDVYSLMHEQSGSADATYLRYLDRLRKLTAKEWQAGGNLGRPMP